MSNDRPPIGPLGLALRARLEGRRAHAAGAPAIECPYVSTVRPFSRRAWFVGWLEDARRQGDRLPSDVADVADEDAPAPA